MLQPIELLHDAWPDHTIIQGHFRGHVRGVPQVCLAPATAYGVAKVWCSRYGCCEARVSHCQFSSVLARCWVGAVAASPKYYPQSQSRPWSPPELEILNLTSLECPLQHANWSRQARRLQSVRFAKAARPGVDPRHAAKVWGAIQRARGLNRALVSGGKNAHSKLPSIPQHGWLRNMCMIALSLPCGILKKISWRQVKPKLRRNALLRMALMKWTSC